MKPLLPSPYCRCCRAGCTAQDPATLAALRAALATTGLVAAACRASALLTKHVEAITIETGSHLLEA